MPGRSTSGVHQKGRLYLHQARSGVGGGGGARVLLALSHSTRIIVISALREYSVQAVP